MQYDNVIVWFEVPKTICTGRSPSQAVHGIMMKVVVEDEPITDVNRFIALRRVISADRQLILE